MKSFSDLRSNISEKTLTPAEMKKREEIAKAIERDNPDMPMAKKMAIATATAKKVAEEQEDVTEALTTLKPGRYGGMDVVHTATGKRIGGVAERGNRPGTYVGIHGSGQSPDQQKEFKSQSAAHEWVRDRQAKQIQGTRQLVKATSTKVAEEREGVAEGSVDSKYPHGEVKHRIVYRKSGEKVEGVKPFTSKAEAQQYAAKDPEYSVQAYKVKQGVAEAIITQPPKKVDIPAAIRKAKGGNWKTTTQDIEADKLRNQSSSQSLAAGRKKEGMAEANNKQTWPGHSDTVKNPNFNDELSIRRIGPPGRRLKSGKLSADERGQQERTKTLMKFQQKKGGLTGPKSPLPEEVELDESKMAELHSDIADMMDKHISKYNKVGGSEALMAKVDPAAKKLAAMHAIEHAAARRHISSYIDTQIKEENSLSEVNDYFKRRAKEEGIIAGTKPARKAPKKAAEPMSDYSKRRAKEGSVN